MRRSIYRSSIRDTTNFGVDANGVLSLRRTRRDTGRETSNPYIILKSIKERMSEGLPLLPALYPDSNLELMINKGINNDGYLIELNLAETLAHYVISDAIVFIAEIANHHFRTLKRIDLSSNKLTPQTQEKFLSRLNLEGESVLESIDLSNQIKTGAHSPEFLSVFLERLQKNISLNTLKWDFGTAPALELEAKQKTLIDDIEKEIDYNSQRRVAEIAFPVLVVDLKLTISLVESIIFHYLMGEEKSKYLKLPTEVSLWQNAHQPPTKQSVSLTPSIS
jgi:hypothetical protein